MPDLDPSRVYGYVALVDPDTEQPHLLVNYDTVPPTASIALYWLTFHFVNPTIPTQTADVRIDGGFRPIGSPPKAFLYDVEMLHDRSALGNPYSAFAGGRNRILYNPDRWHFDSIAPGNFSGNAVSRDAAGVLTSTRVIAPLTQRATPFADPDLAPLG